MRKKTDRTSASTSTSADKPKPYLHLCDEIAFEVDLTRRARTPAEFVAGVAIVHLQGHLVDFKQEGFSVWNQRDQEGRQVRYPARKYQFTNNDGQSEQGTYVLFRTVKDGDFSPRKRLNDLILEAVDAAISRAQQPNAAA